MIGDEETDVMPRLFVLAARISETGNQTNLWSFFFQTRSIENPKTNNLS